MRFEWDEQKNAANRRRHGVSFEEAATVFYDDTAILYDDPDHSDHEQRFILLGWSLKLRVRVVVHCVAEAGDVIRIVSARKATKRERAAYARGAR